MNGMEKNNSKYMKQEFGKKVRYFRKQRSMTQDELADRIDKTVETVSNIERGVTSTGIDMMCRLADALDVMVKDFFVEVQVVNPFLDKEKIKLSQEIISLMEPKSKKYLRSLQVILTGD